MPDPDGWETAFVAMRVALGATVDEARGSLDEAARERVAGFCRALSAPAREARAKALAAGLGRIAVVIEKARLA
jgi:hypothetical protein